MKDRLAATQFALQTIEQRLDTQNSRFNSFMNMVTTYIIGDIVIFDMPPYSLDLET